MPKQFLVEYLGKLHNFRTMLHEILICKPLFIFLEAQLLYKSPLPSLTDGLTKVSPRWQVIETAEYTTHL